MGIKLPRAVGEYDSLRRRREAGGGGEARREKDTRAVCHVHLECVSYIAIAAAQALPIAP
jgi:hypothetical protein